MNAVKLTYHGHACFSLHYENGAVLVIDPFDPSVTFPPCEIACDAALLSHDHFDHNYTGNLRGEFATIRTAGEHEVKGVKITAIPSFHDKEKGALRGSNLIFRMEAEGLSIAHLGDLGHMPNENQLAALQNLDVLLVPIGGTYTIDTPEAEELIRALRPKHAVAMHFRTEAYDINVTTCDAFAEDMSAARMPREVEITRETIGSLPETMIMNYK